MKFVEYVAVNSENICWFFSDTHKVAEEDSASVLEMIQSGDIWLNLEDCRYEFEQSDRSHAEPVLLKINMYDDWELVASSQRIAFEKKNEWEMALENICC